MDIVILVLMKKEKGSGKMLLVRIVENNKMMLILGQVRLSKG